MFSIDMTGYNGGRLDLTQRLGSAERFRQAQLGEITIDGDGNVHFQILWMAELRDGNWTRIREEGELALAGHLLQELPSSNGTRRCFRLMLWDAEDGCNRPTLLRVLKEADCDWVRDI